MSPVRADPSAQSTPSPRRFGWPRRSRSLSAFITLRVTLFLMLVVSLTTFVIYRHVQEERRTEMLDDLVRFNHERVEQQNQFFDTIDAVHREANRRLAAQLDAMGDADVSAEFDRLFPLRPDGTRRSISGLFDGMDMQPGDRVHGIGAFIAGGRAISPDDKRLLLAAFHVVRGLGDSFGPNLRNFYFFTPDNRLVLFGPERDDRLLYYRQEAPATLDFQGEEMSILATPAGNPERRLGCTGLRHKLQDAKGESWLSACVTPFDRGGRHLGAFGNSIEVSELLRAIPGETLPGSHPVLIAQDGRLLRHGDGHAPGHVAAFSEISGRGSRHLRSLWDAARDSDGSISVVDDGEQRSFVAVERTRGPRWFSLLVYPESKVREQASATASLVLYVGLASLLLQALGLFWLFRRVLVAPLERFIRDTETLAAHGDGDLPEALPTDRADELGTLARAFATMAQRVAEGRHLLEARVEERTAALRLKTRELHSESQRLSALRRIGAAIAAELERERVIQVVIDAATELTQSRFGLFYLAGADGRFGLACHCDADLATLDRLSATRPDLFENPAFERDIRLLDETQSGAALLLVPVIGREGTVRAGMLFGHPNPDRFDSDALQSLADVAAQAAVALDNADLYENARRELQERVRTEDRLRLAVEAAGFGAFDWDVDKRTHRWTPEMKAIYGFAAEAEVSHEQILAAYHPDDREKVRTEFAEHLSFGSNRLSSIEFRIIRPDGEVRWVLARARNHLTRHGTLKVRGIVQDITDRKQSETSLQLAKERLGLALDSTGVGVWDWDIAADRLWQSASALVIQGLDPNRRSSNIRTYLRHVHPKDRVDGFAFFRKLVDGTSLGTVEIEYRLARSGGGWVWVHERCHVVEHDEEGRPKRIVGTRHDISARKESDAQLLWTANHDSLTGLANRGRFRAALDAQLAAREKCFGLLLIDLDGFKQVNDTLGHDAGDLMLQVAARRLAETVGANGEVARLGGDEFAVILPGVADSDHLASWAMQIQDAFATPIAHRGRSLDLCSTIGGTLCPRDGSEASMLLKNADLALYEAKAERRGGFVFYEEEMRRRLEAERTTLVRVREAIADRRIMAYYQPQVSLHTEALVGFEALLRWRHPATGVMLPGSIASAFEDPELAVSLGEMMNELVIADLKRWRARGIDFGRVAINASSAEFRDGQYASRLLARLAAADVPTSAIEVEVTESVFLGRGAGPVHEAMDTLSKAGVTIALDDFGTGYASLTHLKQFPVEIIKIDRSFVRDMETDPDDAAIVRAVVGLGQSLGKKVVAEGVETVGQMRMLTHFGCAMAQGFLFHPPADGEEVEHLVRQWRSPSIASPIERMINARRPA